MRGRKPDLNTRIPKGKSHRPQKIPATPNPSSCKLRHPVRLAVTLRAPLGNQCQEKKRHPWKSEPKHDSLPRNISGVNARRHDLPASASATVVPDPIGLPDTTVLTLKTSPAGMRGNVDTVDR